MRFFAKLSVICLSSLSVLGASIKYKTSSSSVSQKILSQVATDQHGSLNGIRYLGVDEGLENMQEYAALVVSGKDFEQASSPFEKTSVKSILVKITEAHQASLPIILTDVYGEDKALVFEALQMPIKQVPKKGKSSIPGSSVLLLDTFQDDTNAVHYRLINLPNGKTSRQFHQPILDGSNQLIFRPNTGVEPTGPEFLCFVTSSKKNQSQAFNEEKACRVKADEETLSEQNIVLDVVKDIRNYLKACGGVGGRVYSEACHGYMRGEFRGFALKGMVPETGAVWREIIETTFSASTVEWQSPFPFTPQEVSHRVNTYWYLYMQAPPFAQQYYVAVLVDGIHNPETKVVQDDAVGLYLSRVSIQLQALNGDGNPDPENIYWIKSSPATQNTKHEEGRQEKSTDEYEFAMNLGYDGEVVKGDVHFKYTHTFEASYHETREITDWSVVQNTNPLRSTGEWLYHQTWPVDMLQYGHNNFPQYWELFYASAWNPCRVKQVPNLSKYAFDTHNSIVWGVKPVLRSADARSLPIRFSLSLTATVNGHTCENFDGHHKLGTFIQTADSDWEVNVADLNNIQWK